MPIRQDFIISFDEQEYIRLHDEGFQRLLKQPSRQAAFQDMVAEIKAAIRPAAVWDRFPIQAIQHEKVLLANGTKLGGGPVVTVIGGAEELIVAVCTIGAEADKRIQSYQQRKELFRALLLDELASWAIDMVRQELCRWLEAGLKGQGLRVSAPLSPGESIWSVTDQRIIFKLLDTSPIQVSLSESMIMYPLKSLSLILGTGHRPMGVEGATNCDFCSIKERCAYRRLRPDPHPSLVS
jgi:hypothetical protein